MAIYPKFQILGEETGSKGRQGRAGQERKGDGEREREGKGCEERGGT